MTGSKQASAKTSAKDITHKEGIDAKGLARLGLTISKVSQIGRQLTFETAARLSDTVCLGLEEIGAFSYCGPKSELKNATIGRFCSIAPNVSIGAPEHPIDWVSSHPVQYDGLTWFSEAEHWTDFANPDLRWRGNSHRTMIGNDVWIGRNVVVRQGVTVGDGAIIGANSFVNRDVPSYAIFAGQPARLIRYRFSEETRDILLDLRWWDSLPPKGEHLRYDVPENFIKRWQELRSNGQLKRFEPKQYCVRNVGGSYEVKALGSDQIAETETISSRG
jgi:acetyltransferase-like isoleucine patch superfamily enzyme